MLLSAEIRKERLCLQTQVQILLLWATISVLISSPAVDTYHFRSIPTTLKRSSRQHHHVHQDETVLRHSETITHGTLSLYRRPRKGIIISLQAGYERPNAKDTLAGQADTDEMGDVFLGEDAKTGTQIRRAMQKNESTSH